MGLTHKKKITPMVISWFTILILTYSISSLNIVEPANFEKDQHKNLEYPIYFQQPIFTETHIENTSFTQITIPDCISNAQPGHPILPTKSIRIIIPYNSDISTIIATPDFSQSISYTLKDKLVIPQQEPQIIGNYEKPQPFIQNTSVYLTKTPLNNAFFSVTNIGFCKGIQILTLQLYPLQYNPQTGDLQFFPQINIQLQISKLSPHLSKQHQFIRLNSNDIDTLKTIVINPEELSSYPKNPPILSFTSNGLCNSSDTYEYVLITTEELSYIQGETYNWSDLITHRQNYGNLNATMVTVESINNCSAYWNATPLFNDSAAKIREFIKDAYTNWETQYVLLGGDWDTSNEADQIVPYRSFTVWERYGSDYADMPCDMYYSHLDGDWRDTDHNVWGGGKDSQVNDLFGELSVGRLTVSTAEQVSNIIGKIIWYDLLTEEEFIQKAVFFGCNLGSGFDVTSADYMEEIRNGTNPYFYSCQGFASWNENNSLNQFNISNRVYYDWGASIPSEYQTTINNNDACIINHLGHGSTTTAFSMTNAQLSALSNTKYFMSYSQQCLSARFIEGNTPEKTLLCSYEDNGAFALIWNTGYGWGDGYSTNGSSQFLQRQFWHYLFTNNQENWRISTAHDYSKDQLSAYINMPGWHYCWCYTWYSTHLFGDPAQKLQASSINTNIIISDETPSNCSIDIEPGNVIISVSVEDIEGDDMNISIRTNSTGSWETIYTEEVTGNETFFTNYNFSEYNTTYWWSVNASDITGNSGYANETYCFTTRIQHIVTPPSLFHSSSFNRTQINLTWASGENASTTYIERFNQLNWSFGDGIEIFNGTSSNFSDINLNPNTTYFYRAWSWDSEDNIWSITNSSTYNTTDQNNYPVISNEIPATGVENISFNPTLSVEITDFDNDVLNISIWTNASGIWSKIGGNIELHNTTFSCNGSSMTEYETLYYWSANCSDSYDWINETYNFTTKQNRVPIITIESPTNQSTNISISLSQLSVNISDFEGDSFNWSIETAPNVGNITNFYHQNGTKNCSISNLQYNTTYNWYVNVSDDGNQNLVKKRYVFSTEYAPNYAPVFSGENPANETIGISRDLSKVTIIISDPEGDRFNWSIETLPDVGSNFGINETNGSKSCFLSGLEYNMQYYWYVNTTDITTGEWSNISLWFRTKQRPFTSEPPAPPPIVENTPPEKPEVLCSIEEGFIGSQYNITISSIDADEDLIRFRIDWDDSNMSTWSSYKESGSAVLFSHVWASEGTYLVRGICQDYNGENSSWSYGVPITIFNNNDSDMMVEFEVDFESNIITNSTVHFNISNLSDFSEGNYTFFWDFGDGNTLYGVSPKHQYRLSGTYCVTLQIFNSEGVLVNETLFWVSVLAESDSVPLEDGIDKGHDFMSLYLVLFFVGFGGFICVLYVYVKYVRGSSYNRDYWFYHKKYRGR